MQTQLFSVALLALQVVPLSQAQSKPRIQLSTTMVMPGEVAGMRMKLETQGEQIIATESELSIPAQLSFVAAEAGEAGKLVSATVKTETLPEVEGTEQTRLSVRIEAASGKFLSDGVIGMLKFKATGDVPEKDLPVYLTLGYKVFITTAEKQRVAAEGSKVDVILVKDAPTIAPCFFYMH